MGALAIIFDFDGTILDTERAIYDSWLSCYREHGLDIPIDDWIDVLGRASNHRDFHAELEQKAGVTLDRSALTERRRAEVARRLDGEPPRPGVETLLDGARDREIPLAVASGSGHGWVEGHLHRLELHHFFRAFVCREDTELHKPHPEPYLAAAQAIAAAPADCVAIEDSPNGVRSAKAAGMRVIAVPGSLLTAAHFEQSGADRVVESLADISVDALLEV